MVSLPCRRARKGKNASTIPEETHAEPQAVQSRATQTSDPEGRAYTGEEGRALESLFQHMDLPDAQTDLVMPSTRQSTAKDAHVKERHSRLELLPKRLRNRISKESRLLKSKSKLSIIKQNDGPIDNQSSVPPGSNFLPDILGSGPASEGGYDSDAQGILTPRAEPSVADSIGISAENLNSISKSEPKGLKNATADTQGISSWNGTQNTRNIEGISNPRIVDLDAILKTPIALSSESLDSGGLHHPLTPKTNETQSALLKVPVKVSPKDSEVVNARCPKLSVTPARASRATEPAEPSENMSWLVPQRSSSSVTPVSHRQISLANRNIGSTLGAALNPFDRLSFLSNTSDPYGKTLKPRDARIQRDASSLYASHPNSLPPSPDSSTRYVPLALPQELCSIAGISSLHEAEPAAMSNAPDPVESNHASTRKGEPGIPDSDSQDRIQNDTLLLENGLDPGQPTQSKFTEQLGSLGVKQGNTARSLKRNSERSSGGSRSTSDGWLSGGKRQGYGYDFVSETDEDTNIMWQKALKAHAEGTPVRSRQPSQNSFNWKRNRQSRKSNRDSSGHSLAKTSAIRVPAEERASPQDHGKIQTSRIGVVRSKKEKDSENNPVRSLRTWSKFPSHSRAERCASAGTTDNITVRDFSSTHDQRPILESGLGSPQVDGQVERETSRKMGKEWLRSWTKLSRRRSADLRRYRAGHRSGVSRSGYLKYPELELIPDGPRPYVVMEELGNVEKASRKFLRRQKEQGRAKPSTKVNEPDQTHPDSSGIETESKPDSCSEVETDNEFVLAPLPPLTPDPKPDPRHTDADETAGVEPSTVSISAQMWSRLYDDCVNRPASDNGADALSLTSISSRAVALPEQGQDQRLTTISTSIDLHSSTAEFKELQLADEVKTRDSLMRMVEAAWGADLSDTRTASTSQSRQKGCGEEVHILTT